MSFIDGIATFKRVGIPTQDPITYEMIYPDDIEITIDNATFNQLSSTETVERQQLQDNSTHKIRIDFNDTNKTIDHTYTVTTESIEYNITGKPKHPTMDCGRITIYLLRKSN